MSQINIAFTAPFPIEILEPEIKLTRPVQSHPASWIQVLANELSKYEKINIHILTINAALKRDQVIKKGRITYHVLRTSLPFARRSYGLTSSYTLFALPCIKLIQKLKMIRPDIVHGHGTEGPYALAAVYSGIPNIVSIQGIITEIMKSAPSFEYMITAYLERHTLRRAMAINTKTVYSASFADTITPGTRQYFIEAPINSIYWERPIPSPARNIFFVGTLIKRKGIEELIRAVFNLAERWPDLKCFIIGTGNESYVDYLKQLVASFPREVSIEFLGQLKSPEIAALFSRGGVFCLPSYIENSPNTVMEAMAAGLPTVVTDVGNLRNMIKDQKSGLLIQTHSVTSIQSALAAFFLDFNFHTEAGQLGRKIASRRWRADIIAEKHLEMYRDLLSSQKKEKC